MIATDRFEHVEVESVAALRDWLFGWIDGIARKLDDDRTMQLIFPQKQLAWAQSYKDRVARLQRDGRMAAPGRAAIEESKRLGLWDAYAAIDALLVPDDLLMALKASSAAELWFNASPLSSHRRNILRWLSQAKRADTRTRRIDAVVTAAAHCTRVPQL